MEMEDNQILPRLKAFSASLQGKIYVWGGKALDSSTTPEKSIPIERKLDSTLYCYDPSKEEWTLLQTTDRSPPFEIQNGASGSTDTHLYSCGGSDGSYYDSYLYRLDVGALKWEKLPPYPRVDEFYWRDGCKMICSQERLLFVGGLLSYYKYSSSDGAVIAKVDVYVFNFKEGEM